VFIGGAAGTGKSTALRQLGWAWVQRNPTGTIVHVDREHPLDPAVFEAFGEAAAPPVLVTVDDADRVDDVAGHLAAIVEGRRRGVTIMAAARLEAVRVAYGHWVREVTRSRCGVIMTSLGEVDGDLLGATLPRRSVIRPRPGLGWLIDAQGHRLVQVAARMPA
jgi:S-DNA-T family DNA segregation ATPase FtsK/SpoIIIE